MQEKTPPQTSNNKDKIHEQNRPEENSRQDNSAASEFLEAEKQISPRQDTPFKTEENLNQDHTQLTSNLDFILDIPLEISVELGRTKMRIADIMKLGQGSIIELANPAGSSLEVLVNQKPIAKGEVVVVNEKYGIRLIEILSVIERIEKLK